MREHGKQTESPNYHLIKDLKVEKIKRVIGQNNRHIDVAVSFRPL